MKCLVCDARLGLLLPSLVTKVFIPGGRSPRAGRDDRQAALGLQFTCCRRSVTVSGPSDTALTFLGIDEVSSFLILKVKSLTMYGLKRRCFGSCRDFKRVKTGIVCCTR